MWKTVTTTWCTSKGRKWMEDTGIMWSEQTEGWVFINNGMIFFTTLWFAISTLEEITKEILE